MAFEFQLYTAAIETDSNVAEYFVKRAQTYIKLSKYKGKICYVCMIF